MCNWLLVCCSLFLLISSTAGPGEGAVELSPSEVAPVCQVGGQLELTCTVTGMFLRWVVFNISHIRLISSAGKIEPFTIDSTMITFSRVNDNVQPLKSRLTIFPVTASLNGSVVTCGDVETHENSSTAIYIVDANSISSPRINLGVQSEEFTGDTVDVVMNWTYSNAQPYHHNISIDVVPHSTPPVFFTNNTIQLSLSYNTHYYVSATPTTQCGQESETVHIELLYNKCADLDTLSQETGVIINGYEFEAPALEGLNVSFSCPPGLELNGPNTTTCMENGEWEPDPFKLKCEDVDCVPGSNEGVDSTLTCVESSSSQKTTIIIAVSGAGGVLLSLGTVTLVLSAIVIAKRKGLKAHFSREIRSASPGGDDVTASNDENDYIDNEAAERTLVYAHLGPSSFNNKRVPPPVPMAMCIENTTVEYARLDHHKISLTNSLKQLEDDENKSKDCVPEVNLDNLLLQLRPQVSAKWYLFGEAVGIERELLDNCAKHCLPENRLVEVFDYWLRCCCKEKPSWRDVAKIVRDISLPQLAADIESVYVTGKLPIEVDLISDSVQVSILCSKQETPPPPIPPKSFVTPRSSPRKAHTERRLLSASKNSLFSAAATTNELAPPPVPLRTYASDIALAPPLPPKPKNL